MSRDELDRLERRMWASYHQDGMWDVFLGVLMLMMAVGMIVDHWLISVLGFLIVLSIIVIKKMLLEKRIGKASWSMKRRIRKKKVMLIILLANFLTALLLLMTVIGVSPGKWAGAIVLGGMVLITFSAVSYFMNFWRFMLWGSLMAFAIVVNELTEMESSYYLFIFIGSMAVTVGIYHLIIFLKRNPALKESG